MRRRRRRCRLRRQIFGSRFGRRVPSHPYCGCSISPVVRTVTGVQLALIYAPWVDGKGAVLVPAYLFTVDDGSTIPVLGLPERFLTPPDQGPPQTKPSAAGGTPAVR